MTKFQLLDGRLAAGSGRYRKAKTWLVFLPLRPIRLSSFTTRARPVAQARDVVLRGLRAALLRSPARAAQLPNPSAF